MIHIVNHMCFNVLLTLYDRFDDTLPTIGCSANKKQNKKVNKIFKKIVA